MATITVMDASAKADLETNKDSLNSYDYSSIKSSVENARKYQKIFVSLI